MESVLEELRKIDAVKEAYMLYGVYDVIAKVEADTMDKLKEIVTWKVRRLDKVQSTQTMMVIE
jgi:DNA-binding Lrp family transcriptional regulator